MGQTKIEWTSYQRIDGSWVPGYSFNPWLGCSKISPACRFCYAENWAKRSGLVKWGDHPRRRTSAANWREPLKWNRAAEAAGERRRVFCASLADVFEHREEVKPWREDLWRLIEQTPHLDWMLLTKRPENLSAFVPWRFGAPWPNVWLGTTVEDQLRAVERVPQLLSCRAVIHFLSCEPLLSAIDFHKLCPHPFLRWRCRQCDARTRSATCPVCGYATERVAAIDWVIAGGESGANARPMHPDWARSLRDQSVAAGVPFFFKQHGAWISKLDCGELTPDGWRVKTDWRGLVRGKEWGCLTQSGCYLEGTTTWNDHQNDPRYEHEVIVYNVGKQAAGRLLDGVEWSELPEVAS